MTINQIEIAVADYFNPRVNIIVPNISWGLDLHECDLLVLTRNNYAYEVEIKTSRADLKADLRKPHAHSNKKISRLYFAIPECLQCSADLIPKRSGILVIIGGGDEPYCQCVRDPCVNHDYQWTAKQREKLLLLGSMRIWTLKKTIKRWEEGKA